VSAEEPLDPTLVSAVDQGGLQPTQAIIPAEAPGAIIGRYHLLQKIGEGGMGEVWLAEQKEPVRRRVALKLVKAGMNTREVIARFESERQALALMDHPSIAKVLDAGSAPNGAPYFVMEYVAGVPITDYCDNHRLSTRERLELFVRVCEGVQHAHQKAIIHRDLKPSNILVTEVDGKAAPKIIDFGVAKALTQKLTADTMFTRVGVLLGTPEYMSPEQALSSGEDIDTRTDVYSLGIIFYELLAGAPPIELRKLALDEFLRRLREQDPQKLSVMLRTQDRATSIVLAQKRRTEPPELARQVRGDLDCIALKAIEKDRSRRYGSPSDFAADIGRYLNNEAVLAVPPSVAYRVRKFARRYRVALATGCAFALVLIVAAAVSIRQSIRANREAAVAQAVDDFLQNDVLAQASAANQSAAAAKPDSHLEVRTALDRAAQRIAGKFDRQPEVEAAIRLTIGKTYRDLGIYPEARKQLEEALRLRTKVLGAENPQTLATAGELAWLALWQGRYAEAEALAGRTLELERLVVGPERPDTLFSMSTLAAAYRAQGKYPQAEALFSQVLEIRRRVLGPENPATLFSLNNLASAYSSERKYARAETLYSQDLELERRVLGPEDPHTLMAMSNLALTYVSQGKYPQASAIYRQLLEIRRRALGPEHPDTLGVLTNLGEIAARQGKFPEAELFYSQALDGERKVLGPAHPTVVGQMADLGFVYLSEGKYAQAEPLLTEALEIGRRASGPESPDVIPGMDTLAELYRVEGKYGPAETLYHQTVELERRVFGPQDPNTLISTGGLALTYYLEGKYAQAEDLYTQILAGRKQRPDPENPDTLDSMADLALTNLAQGKFSASEALAREAVEWDRKSRPDAWQRFFAESLLGASLAGQTKYAEGEPLLLAGYQGMDARKDLIAAPDRYHLDRAGEWLVQLYRAWGKPDKAAKWAQQEKLAKAAAEP